MKRFALLGLLAVLVLASPAFAQSVPPPNFWHPYRGGTNCVQVADSSGNFNCSASVTIDPVTGIASFAAGVTGVTVTVTNTGLQIISSGTTGVQRIGNDLIIGTTGNTVAQSGPDIQGVVLRVRQSPIIPGYCRVVVAGNNAMQEWPLMVANPNLFQPSALQAQRGQPFLGSVDFPGGPGGC